MRSNAECKTLGWGQSRDGRPVMPPQQDEQHQSHQRPDRAVEPMHLPRRVPVEPGDHEARANPEQNDDLEGQNPKIRPLVLHPGTLNPRCDVPCIFSSPVSARTQPWDLGSAIVLQGLNTGGSTMRILIACAII